MEEQVFVGREQELAELPLLAPGCEAEAESCLWQALDPAREQKGRALELRAATSLACLLREQGRAAEGKKILRQRRSLTYGRLQPLRVRQAA